MKYRRFKSINNLDMIRIGNINWRIQHENDGSEVFEVQLGDPAEAEQDILTALYGKGTLSIREFYSTWGGGFTLFMEMPLASVPRVIQAIMKAHKLTLMPLYDKDTTIEI